MKPNKKLPFNKPASQPAKPRVELEAEEPEVEVAEEVTENDISPLQEYFDSLDDAEKEELCSIAESYKASKMENEEVDMESIAEEMGGE